MTKNNCLAIASTPLHVIYIIEFIHKHSVNCTDLIILLKRQSDKPQIEKILNEHKWSSIQWVNACSKLANSFISIFEMLFSFKSNTNNQSYQYGIFADYGRTILANQLCSQYYWLGDGTKILHETSPEHSTKLNRYEKHKLFDKFFKLILKKNLTLSIAPTIFSPFRLGIGKQELNTFEWLESKYKKLPIPSINNTSAHKNIYFFGAYFCEVDGRPLMSEQQYLDIIKKIVKYYKLQSKNITYVPHRHESKQKLILISAIPNITIDKFDYPAEYQFIVRGNKPYEIASFCSTCLFHFHYLKSTHKITSFYIDFSKYTTKQNDRMETFYRSLAKLIGKDNIIDVDTIE